MNTGWREGRGAARWIPAALVCVLLAGGVHAARVERRKVDVITYADFAEGARLAWTDARLPTRKGVRQRLLIARAPNAGARAVLLFMGGAGTPIARKRGRRLKTGRNFLVRSAPLFARAGFVAAIVDAPSDRSGGMDVHFRASEAHHADVRAAVDLLAGEGAREIFLIGTSRGAISVAYLASVMRHPNVRGFVLTASAAEVVFYAEDVEAPVLMAHHADDECRAAPYVDARAAYRAMRRSPRKRFVTVSGGDAPLSHPCRALSAHGFIGAERETVGAIVEWMNGGTPPEYVSP